MPTPPPVGPHPRAVPPKPANDPTGTSCRHAADHKGFKLAADTPFSEGTTYVTSNATIEFVNDDTKVRTIVDSDGILWGRGGGAVKLLAHNVLPGKTVTFKTVTVVNFEKTGWIEDGRGPDAPFHTIIVCPVRN